MKRRAFMAGTLTGLSACTLPAWAGRVPKVGAAAQPAVAKPTDRAYWLDTLLRVAEPVLAAGGQGQLKALMPIEAAPGQQEGRRQVSHLEALGRTLAGLAPWLELPYPPRHLPSRPASSGSPLWPARPSTMPPTLSRLIF